MSSFAAAETAHVWPAELRNCCDVRVSSGDGVCFACHRCVLASQSHYFHAMFTQPCAERLADTVQLALVRASALRPCLALAYALFAHGVDSGHTVPTAAAAAQTDGDRTAAAEKVASVAVQSSAAWSAAAVLCTGAGVHTIDGHEALMADGTMLSGSSDATGTGGDTSAAAAAVSSSSHSSCASQPEPEPEPEPAASEHRLSMGGGIGRAARLLVCADYLAMDGVMAECEHVLASRMAADNCVRIYRLAKRLGRTELRQRAWLYLLYTFKQLVPVTSQEELVLPKPADERRTPLQYMLHCTLPALRDERRTDNADAQQQQQQEHGCSTHVMDVEEAMDISNSDMSLGTSASPVRSSGTATGRTGDSRLADKQDTAPMQDGDTACGVSDRHQLHLLDYEDMCRLLAADSLNSGSHLVECAAVQYWHRRRRNRLHQNAQCSTEGDYERAAAALDAQAHMLLTLVRYQHSLPIYHLHASRELCDMVERHKEAYDRKALPRLPDSALLAIGGWHGEAPTATVESWDERLGRWHVLDQLCSPLGARAYHCAAVVGGQLYVVGGYDGTRHHSGAHSMHMRTMEWRQRCAMHQRRCYAAAAPVALATGGNGMLVAGGFNGHGTRLRTVEMYTPQHNQWTPVASMQCVRSDAHMAELNDKLYMVGGFDGSHCLQSGEWYDSASDSWHTIAAPMSEPRSGVGACSMHNAVYVCGGFNGTKRSNTLDRFDPRMGSWHVLRPMPTGRSNFGMASCHGLVHVVGGYNGTATVPTVEVYEARMDTWFDNVPHMNVARSALYMLAIDAQTVDMRPFCPRG